MTKPYCIGSNEWNGLSKLIEELGELQQVCGKLLGSEGSTDHWSGDLQTKFIEEIADAYAAMDFFVDHNFDDDECRAIMDRTFKKNKTFVQWDQDVRDAECA